MARVSAHKRAELESFWRSHHEGWQASDLNQREYCELHGLPLKRFGNWRAQFMGEEAVARSKLLWRRGGKLRHMASHMSDRENPESTGYVPSGLAVPETRRNFRLSDKKRIVAEAMAPGNSIAAVARRYGIDRPLLCRWKRDLAPPDPEPVFLSVTINDGAGEESIPSAVLPGSTVAPVAAPVIIERARDEIEVELVGGRRMRFARDTDPATIRSMVDMLEGTKP